MLHVKSIIIIAIVVRLGSSNALVDITGKNIIAIGMKINAAGPINNR